MVTISTALPTLALIKSRMSKATPPSVEDTALTKAMKSEIQSYLDRHFSTDQGFYQKASFLDPRFKSRFSPGIELELKGEAELLFPTDPTGT